jgi:hypothetical protein
VGAAANRPALEFSYNFGFRAGAGGYANVIVEIHGDDANMVVEIHGGAADSDILAARDVLRVRVVQMMSQWVQMGRWWMLACVGAVACGGGNDPQPPRGGPPGGRLTIPNDAFGGSAGGAVASTGGIYNYAGAPIGGGGVVGAGGILVVGGTGGFLATGGALPSTGGASPVAYCTGSATPCLLLGNSQCASAQGCDLAGKCDGYAESCSSQFYSSTCYGIQGCYWSSSGSGYCSGSSWTCDLFSGSASCIGQPGCDWTESCDGVVTPCSLLSEVDCAIQPGCRLEYR